MSFLKRRREARAPRQKVHECPRCGMVIWGNGYYNHRRACMRDSDLKGVQVNGMTEVEWEK